VCRRAPSARRTSRARPASRQPVRDSAALAQRQLRALLGAIARELTWAVPCVRRELRHWHDVAARIPIAALREEALDALHSKRGQSEGAALFSILPRRRNRSYLRLLVAYQVIWDYLDSVNERSASAGLVNGRQLHLALIDALDPDAPIRDYFAHSPWVDDGGYLRALVETCRECCGQLPAYAAVQPVVLRDAQRAQVLALNHEPDPALRDAALRTWAAQELPNGGATWFELSGAASAALATFALLALACEESCSDAEIARTHGAYFPWVSASATMLDSYVDQDEDVANGDHVYVAHYATPQGAVSRICELVARAVEELHALRDAETHLVIASCMVGLYLSKDSARMPAMRHSSDRIAQAGGALTRALVHVLRVWRVAHSLSSS
jgi:tetraprenyl-beta-curcumene synthase